MIPGPIVNPGQTVYLDLSQYVTDENSPVLPLTYALTGGPSGASLNPTTGLFTWATPANQPLGVVTFTFQVYDSLTSASPTQGSITIDFGLPDPPSRRPCSRRWVASLPPWARRSHTTSRASLPTPTRRPCR